MSFCSVHKNRTVVVLFWGAEGRKYDYKSLVLKGRCLTSVELRHFPLYRRTSMSGTKKAQITFPLRHLFPLKVVK
jgi:hypothetical protein